VRHHNPKADEQVRADPWELEARRMVSRQGLPTSLELVMGDDDFDRVLLGRVLIGAFIILSLLVGPALAFVTRHH
jgi:hypothetical protein